MLSFGLAPVAQLVVSLALTACGLYIIFFISSQLVNLVF